MALIRLEEWELGHSSLEAQVAPVILALWEEQAVKECLILTGQRLVRWAQVSHLAVESSVGLFGSALLDRLGGHDREGMAGYPRVRDRQDQVGTLDREETTQEEEDTAYYRSHREEA
jgi:hypothetical protein